MSESRHAERLIRRGFRTAYRLKAEWHVHYVRDGEGRREEVNARMAELEKLTIRLGGSFAVHEGGKPRETAAAGCAVSPSGRNSVVIGQPKPSLIKEWRMAL